MTTPKIDSEIRSLPKSLTAAFIKMLSAQMNECSNIDFVQATLCTFIRVHRDRIMDSKELGVESENQENIEVPLSASDLGNVIDALHIKLTKSTSELEKLYTETLPVLKWIKSALI
jgi:hypothetical protein